jgi:Zn-dependent M16 (insulinase) family peptidase
VFNVAPRCIYADNDAVRAYHGTYYVPHNLTLIVCGKLASGTSSVLRVVQEQVEPRIAAHKQDRGPRPAGWKRPFVDTASAARAPLKEGRTETVEFPEKDESVGELCMTFMGPPPTAFLERKVTSASRA